MKREMAGPLSECQQTVGGSSINDKTYSLAVFSCIMLLSHEYLVKIAVISLTTQASENELVRKHIHT